MEIRNYNKSTGNKLVDDYLSGQIADNIFYNYQSYSLASIEKHHNYLQQREKAYEITRQPLIECLYKYNNFINCSEKTLKNINKLKAFNARIVITGQQAGLLTGAAFVIYKTITTILLAKKLEEMLGVPVVPLFWIASEDHDFLEVNNCYWWDNKNVKQKKINKPVAGMPSVGDIPLTVEAEQIVASLSDLAGDTELTQKIKEITADSATMSDWFGRIMSYLFHQFGLVMIDPMLPGIRHLSVPIIKGAVSNYKSINKSVQEAGEALEKMTYEPQLNIAEENQIPIFYYENNQRQQLYLEGKTVFYGKIRKELCFYDDLPKIIENNPERFSPNVTIRPIVQDYLLPTLAYVGGPGEISYFAQLKQAYEIFQLRMPVIYPRAQATIIEEQDLSFLESFKLKFPIDSARMTQVQEDMLNELDELALRKRFEEFRIDVEKQHGELSSMIQTLDPELEKLSKKNLNNIINQINYLEKKAWQRHKKNNREVLEKLNSLENWLHPLNKNQEMIFNGLYMLNLYSLQLIERLMKEQMLNNTDKHKLIIIGG